MANEEMVIDVTVNGKKAQVELNKVEKSTDKVGKQTEKTAKKIKMNWKAIGASIAAVGVALAGVAVKGLELERVLFSLTQKNRELAVHMAETHGVSLEQVATYASMAQSMNVSQGAMQGLIQTAIGLGRALPTQSTETLLENLIQLNKTGEAQGFLVDILGAKYGKLNLGMVSSKDKMKLLFEMGQKTNEAFAETNVAEYDKAVKGVGNTISSWGQKGVQWLVDIYNGNEKAKQSFIELSDGTIQLKDVSLSANTALEGLVSTTQELTEANESMGTAYEQASEEMTNTYKENGSAMKSFYSNTFESMGDTITEFVMTGKASFKDFARSVIADLVKVRTMQMITNAFGGIFHTGTTEVKHTGGFIGNLPSHHSGSLRQDERIAKLQVGEAVINRAGASRNREAIAKMNAGQPVGGAAQQTTAEINFNVQAIDASSFNNYLVGNRQTIENIINRSLTQNGSVRQTIKQVV